MSGSIPFHHAPVITDLQSFGYRSIRSKTQACSLIIRIMKITLNGESREVEPGLTVGQLLGELKLEPLRVAVEINQNLVRRATFAETPLREGDRIEIVTFVGGG